MKKEKLIAFGIILLVVSSAVLITFISIPKIKYEKRAIILHSNLLGMPGIFREDFVDIKKLYDQLIDHNYICSWYYYDANESIDFDLLKILKKESKLSKQLVIIIVAHGGYYNGSYYQLLDEFYSSESIMNTLDKTTKIFIYSAGCSSGYFAKGYTLPEKWIILSSVNHESDIGNATLHLDGNLNIISAEIHYFAIEAFTIVLPSCTSIEDVYSKHSLYLAEHYIDSGYFSWDNAPVLWDGDKTTNWIL